jgi:omega-amidase
MQAHLVQLDIAWEDKPANFRKVERLLAKSPVEPGDLILLPEMFDTGFSLNTDHTADREGLTLRFLAELAEDLGAIVQGGRTVHDCHCAKAHNRMTVLGPAGDLLADYTKIHPFSYGREHERFAGGDRTLTYTWAPANPNHNGGRAAALTVCPAICYDLRFPELFRQGLLQGAELFALGACWPEARQSHWRALTIARAIENQAFVLAVNRTGSDPTLRYAGGSIAIGPKGDVIAELGAEEDVLTVPIDPAAVQEWREKFPAWKDSRLLSQHP